MQGQFYSKKILFNITLFNASLVVDSSQQVLQYSAPVLLMIIKDQLFLKCWVGYKLLKVS